MSARSVGGSACASSSDQIGHRSPVSVSSRTIGWSACSDAPMSVIGAAPLRVRSRPGTNVTIMAPGLKPSLRFHSVGSTGTPDEFDGIDAAGKCTRRPVPARRVGDGEEVVRERHEALARRDHVAAVRGRGVDRRLPREAREADVGLPARPASVAVMAGAAVVVVTARVLAAVFVPVIVPCLALRLGPHGGDPGCELRGRDARGRAAGVAHELARDLDLARRARPARHEEGAQRAADRGWSSRRMSTGIAADPRATCVPLAGAAMCTPPGCASPEPGNNTPGVRHATNPTPNTISSAHFARITLPPTPSSTLSGRLGRSSRESSGDVAEEVGEEDPDGRARPGCGWARSWRATR